MWCPVFRWLEFNLGLNVELGNSSGNPSGLLGDEATGFVGYMYGFDTEVDCQNSATCATGCQGVSTVSTAHAWSSHKADVTAFPSVTV
jgi:hypothetical protein